MPPQAVEGKSMKQKNYSYQYSATQNREVEAIRKKYLPKECDKLELLRALDNRVRTAGMIRSLSLGVVGCLVFGLGLCFGLDVMTGPEWLSVVLGIIGACLMAPAYPLYRYVSEKTKKELTPRILALSDEIMRS